MPIILPFDITVEERRVLQEYRRVGADSMSSDAIAAILNPPGRGGEAPAQSLAEKGYLTRGADGYATTAKAQAFLAIDAKPAIPGA